MITLPEEAVEAIRLHGRESYRDEACGVLYGRAGAEGKRVVRAAPMANSREDERHRRFVVTPADYLRAGLKHMMEDPAALPPPRPIGAAQRAEEDRRRAEGRSA